MSQLMEYIKMAFSNIKANKGRSFLTMLGIIIGISSVIMVIAIGNGAKNVITEQMAGIGSGQIYLYSNDTTGSYYITNDDIEAIKNSVDGIKGISASNSAQGTMTTKKGDFTVNGTGVMSDYQYFGSKGMEKGRFFSQEEYLSGQQVAVIGADDAVRLFGSTDVIGMELDVTLGNQPLAFTIVGVQKPENKSFMSFVYENSPINITFPLTIFEKIYGSDMGNYYSVYLLAQDNADTHAITTQVTSLMERRHHCQGQDIYRFENFSDYMSIVNTVINTVTIFISLVAAISLIVGGIGVMNIMLVSVTERTREIGIRKALGAKTRSIMLQFLSESAIITMIGGIIGIALGIGGAYLVSGIVGMVNPKLEFAPALSIPAILIATLFSCGIGIFFGIYPAKKAAKMSPIEALRRL